MKIKSGYILKKVMGSYMIVSLNATEVTGMQTLNETGAFLWDLMQQDTDIDTLTQKLIAEYDIDSTTAKKDIGLFIESLRASSLLDE